ncbi:MAG: hypothetical protein AAGD06_21920 [Acidobacteriota bacterium]
MPFVNYEEACSLIQKEEDPRARSLLSFGLTTAMTMKGLAGDSFLPPKDSFDLLYLTKVIHWMYQRKATMVEILEGDLEQLDWWDEE